MVSKHLFPLKRDHNYIRTADSLSTPRIVKTSLEFLIIAKRKKSESTGVILKRHRNQSDIVFTGQGQDSLGIIELLNKWKHFAYV